MGNCFGKKERHLSPAGMYNKLYNIYQNKLVDY